MVGTGPDVEEDQRPEVDDRQAVGIDRPVGALRNEVVHDGEEAGGQEEADRVMAVPPLEHRILDAAPGDVGLRAERRDGKRRVVAEMQHRDRHDEGEVEPVRDEDVRFLALDDGDEEDEQIDHPDDGQPQVRVPFRLGIFLRLGDAEQIARARDEDEEVVADHDEPGREIAGEANATGLLHDVEGARDQHVAAEGEDHGRGVQRPQPAELNPGQIEVQRRPGQLRGDDETDEEAGDAPEHRHEGAELDRPHVVVGAAVDLRRRQRRRTLEVAVDDDEHRGQARRRAERRMEGERRVERLGRGDHAEEGGGCEHDSQAAFTDGHGFGDGGLAHADSL
ncbi:hypothetical protein ACVIW2_003235 [Bradyrhizobium huanghuaihaiense]